MTCDKQTVNYQMFMVSPKNTDAKRMCPAACRRVVGTNVIHVKNAWFHGRVFKMCQIWRTIHGSYS